MKQFYKKCLAVFVYISGILTLNALTFTSGKVEYLVLDEEERTVAVTGCNIKNDAVVIPEIVNYDHKDYTVTRVGGNAFKDSSVTSVTLPSSISMINNFAFENCKIKYINIPENLNSLGKGAFNNCTFLKEVEIESLENWCNVEIYTDGYNGSPFAAHNGYIKFILNGEEVTHLVIPDGITTIKAATFYNTQGIKEVTFPSTVKEIEEDAFFRSGITSLVIPDNITQLGSHVFGRCENLVDVKIGKGLTNIAFYAFAYCNALEHVEIPETITTIGRASFRDTQSLKEIVLPEGVEVIVFDAFRNSGLRTITLPSTLRSIGELAIDCDNLRTVNCYALTPPACSESPFSLDTYYNGTLNVKEESLSLYQNSFPWSQFYIINGDLPELENGIDSIADDIWKDKNSYIYNLNGVKVSNKLSDIDKLPTGIYIINGRKVLMGR